MKEWSQQTWRSALSARGSAEEQEAYLRLWDYLYRGAFRLSHGDEERAADMAQETLLRVFENVPRFEWRSQVTTWAFSILLNLSNRAYRRQSRERASPNPLERLDQAWERMESMELRSDLMGDLRHCSSQLNPSQRLAICVRTREMSAAQVAERLDTTATYVYKLVYISCRLLRECLEKAGWGRTRFLWPEDDV